MGYNLVLVLEVRFLATGYYAMTVPQQVTAVVVLMTWVALHLPNMRKVASSPSDSGSVARNPTGHRTG